ncbi:SET and MYND domain-containing protein 4-like [Aphidius gifuensis]|uniref:SET and MYND domain-containing protein 4-like n=1 Tax=Aphidius gifuensis TaxID=684658 RepID=UPI001CDC4E1B|nr:SET and MYND domain-containing protein 4-like [Aphidius gifuensis]
MIKELKEPREIIEFIPEIKNDNAIIVGASDAIELKQTNKNDQHIVATRNIKSGEFIWISEPFAAIVNHDLRFTNCWHCCRSTWAGVPCDNCPNIIYCSDICKKKAWDSYHNIECLVLGSLLQHVGLTTEYILPVKLFSKTLNLAGSLLELKKKVDDIDSMKNRNTFANGILDINTIDNFHLLDYLKPTSNDFIFELVLFGVLMVQLFGEKTDILGHKMTIKDLNKNEKSSILGELILRYILTVYRNSQLLTEPGTTAVLSHVISPVWKILKSSCDPNVDWTYVGSNVGYYVIKPIKQGEPVLLATLGSYHLIPKINRFIPLGITDRILCKCKACVENWPTINNLPSYQNIILPKKSKQELNRIMPKWEDWHERVHHGDAKELLTMKDTLNSMNDKLHQYITVPCSQITVLFMFLKTLYKRLHTVHDIYE